LGWHVARPGRIRQLKILVALVLVAIPVNLATMAWADRASPGVTQCNAPLTWDQSALGAYVPVAFVALSIGCVVAAIVTFVRTRHNRPRPIGPGTVVVALIGLIAAIASGFVAALSIGWINTCF
jgi:uncharacterized BrkB/YihY/UPF0761 family membrane protein